MSRIAQTVLGTGTAYAAGEPATAVDLRYGGQQGFAPELTEWVNNAAYVRHNLFCLLLEAPRGFQLLRNADYWVGTLRALVETHVQSIDGLNATLEVDISSNPVGGGGQFQDDYVDVKETQSKVVFKWREKYGMPVHNFHRGWIQNLIMDPNTKFANIATLADAQRPTDLLPDMYAATMIFIEPDPTMTKVVKAWLVTNMFPLSSGDNVGTRDLTQANETPEYSISYTGIAQYNLGIKAFAQRLLDGIRISGANPYNRAAFVDKISQEVVSTPRSYQQGIESLAASAIRV